MKESGNKPELIYPELSYSIIGSAMDVHNGLGPGWDEWDYHRAMMESMLAHGHDVVSHERKDLIHRDRVFDHLELDLLVDGLIVLELKHIRSDFHPQHYTQIINYLKRWEKRLGILINYGMERVGYKRIPYDPVQGTVCHVGKWAELYNRVPELCDRISAAVEGILKNHGSGYGVNIFKKLLMAELEFLGSRAVLPVLSPSYGTLTLGDCEVDSILVDSGLLVSISASGNGASSTELAYLKSYMRQTETPFGILVDIGCSDIQLKGVL